MYFAKTFQHLPGLALRLPSFFWRLLQKYLGKPKRALCAVKIPLISSFTRVWKLSAIALAKRNNKKNIQLLVSTNIYKKADITSTRKQNICLNSSFKTQSGDQHERNAAKAQFTNRCDEVLALVCYFSHAPVYMSRTLTQKPWASAKQWKPSSNVKPNTSRVAMPTTPRKKRNKNGSDCRLKFSTIRSHGKYPVTSDRLRVVNYNYKHPRLFWIEFLVPLINLKRFRTSTEIATSTQTMSLSVRPH